MVGDDNIQKLFRFEVDQSIRVEELARDTIISLANNEKSYALKLAASSKYKIYKYFRSLGRPKKFAPSVFAAGIISAISASGLKIFELVIDIEYPGYELLIINFLKGYYPEILVYFSVIGKKSPAHYAAYGVFKNKKNADFIASAQKILGIIKNDPRTVTPLD